MEYYIHQRQQIQIIFHVYCANHPSQSHKAPPTPDKKFSPTIKISFAMNIFWTFDIIEKYNNKSKKKKGKSTVFANGLGDQGSIPGQVIPKTQKWYLMLPCLTLNIIR